jgi:hypothetical protein
MADDDIDDMDFDDDIDDQEDIDYEDAPPPQSQPGNARRELEKRLEMKRLRELLDYTELDDDF